MRIKKLTLNNFKNYNELKLVVNKDINCLIGDNGSGKTNVLDSIYYLLLTKSFLNTDYQLIKHDKSQTINTITIQNDKEYFISSKVERGKKKQFLIDKEPYKKLQEHIGKFPLVLISPYDTNLIHGGSENRRKFLDGIISQINPSYLDQLLKYSKLIKHRNSVLKKYVTTREIDHKLLDSIDEQIYPIAKELFKIRNAFFEDFLPQFLSRYNSLTENKEVVDMKYESDLKTEDLQQLFNRNKEKDMVLGRTSSGLHKDDYIFLIEDTALSKFGSQGQQKSYVMALKFTTFEILKKEKSVTPILLLDDIFDRIDQNRINQFLDMIKNGFFGQIFITDSHQDRIEKLFKPFKNKTAIFKIENGQLK